MVNCHEIADNYPEFRAVNVNLQKKMEGLQSENADLRSEQNCAAVEWAQMKKTNRNVGSTYIEWKNHLRRVEMSDRSLW